jgi:hypothetical protein
MATRYASNGYLRMGATTVAQATDIQVQSQANAEYVLTTTGESGPTSGIKTVKITVKNAVPRTSTERKRIVRAYQADEIFRFFYRSGDMEFVCEGIIDNLSFASSVNKKDEFDFEIMGTEQPVQDAA